MISNNGEREVKKKMKGDFSSFTFSKKKHYRKVWLQQGRVQVDADWNEQMCIQDYHDTTFLKDIMGQCRRFLFDWWRTMDKVAKFQ